MVKVSQHEGGLMTGRKIIRTFGWKTMKTNIVFLRTDGSLTDVNVNRMHPKKVRMKQGNCYYFLTLRECLKLKSQLLGMNVDGM